MANLEHLGILRQGVSVWNLWRNEHRETRPDFVRAPLNKANLARRQIYLEQITLVPPSTMPISKTPTLARSICVELIYVVPGFIKLTAIRPICVKLT